MDASLMKRMKELEDENPASEQDIRRGEVKAEIRQEVIEGKY